MTDQDNQPIYNNLTITRRTRSRYGWICPCCGRGRSPFSLVCDCTQGHVAFTTTTGPHPVTEIIGSQYCTGATAYSCEE